MTSVVVLIVGVLCVAYGLWGVESEQGGFDLMVLCVGLALIAGGTWMMAAA